MFELIEHRVLGAIRFLDRVTGVAVTTPLQVAATGLTLWRNRSSLHVIAAAPDFEEYVTTFIDPTPPKGGLRKFIFSCSDPAGRYLPRTFTIELPRDPDPATATLKESLFRPVAVPLYPTTTAELGVNWCGIRVSVQQKGGAVTGALLRVVRTSDDALLGSGFSDQRGEALVAIVGIPVTDFSAGDPSGPATGPVVVSEVAARLEVSYDQNSVWPGDCEAREAEHASYLKETLPLTLKTGNTVIVPVSLTL